MAYIEKEKAQMFLRTECLAKYPASFANGLLAAADQLIKFPAADVVPKSEVARLEQDVTRLEQENEALKDGNEHLAVMLEETKIELEAMRGAANSYKMHYDTLKDLNNQLEIDIINTNMNLEHIQYEFDLLRQEKSVVIAEAVKKFAERLCADRVSNDPVVIAVKSELKILGDAL